MKRRARLKRTPLAPGKPLQRKTELRSGPTKRPQNVAGMVPWGSSGWPPNVWIGTSVEDQRRADERIPVLLDLPAVVRFLSCEPLVSGVDLSRWLLWDDGTIRVSDRPVSGIDWVICGGESGPKARPMNPVWALALRDQCVQAGVPFLFKQWGESAPLDQLPSETVASWEIRNGPGFPGSTLCRVGKTAAGRLLDGRTWDEFPVHPGVVGGGTP